MRLNDPGLSTADVRALLRLSGEVRELGRDPEAWRRHLIEGLGRLCGGTLGIAFEHWTPAGVSLEDVRHEWDSFSYSEAPPPPDERSVFDAHRVDRGFDSDRARAHYYEHVYQGEHLGDPAFASLLGRLRAQDAPPEGFTASSRELVDRRTWARSPFVQDGQRGCGMGEYVLSLQFLNELQGVVGLYVARPWGEKPFTAREVALIDLAHEEVRRAIRPGPDAAVAALPRRQRQTLELLLEGKREKEVADVLGISPATVHEYVVALYRRFGVSSRAELSARFRSEGAPGGLRLKGT